MVMHGHKHNSRQVATYRESRKRRWRRFVSLARVFAGCSR